MKKILVVEDEKFLMKVMYDKLRAQGYEVLQAGNGQEGLDSAIANHPDLILLDIIMPVMDGITMLKKLREDVWGKTAKVFIISNLNSSEALEDVKKANITDYFIKSNWKISDLVALVKQVLG